MPRKSMGGKTCGFVFVPRLRQQRVKLMFCDQSRRVTRHTVVSWLGSCVDLFPSLYVQCEHLELSVEAHNVITFSLGSNTYEVRCAITFS